MKKLFTLFRKKPKAVEIPTYAERPKKNDNYAWNRIPLGVGLNEKEICVNLFSAPQILLTGSTGGGKSVVQRNFMAHCIEHPDDWEVYGVDLKRIELSEYKDFEAVTKIATSISDALEVFRHLKETLDTRYALLQEAGLNNFTDLNSKKAIMVLVDEYSLITSSPLESSKEEDEMRAEIAEIVNSIGRLGRAAGIHIVLSTQRHDPDTFNPELKANLGNRISAGRISPEDSTLTFSNNNGVQIDGTVRGRGYIQVYGEGEEYQSYYMTPDELQSILEEEKDSTKGS